MNAKQALLNTETKTTSITPVITPKPKHQKLSEKEIKLLPLITLWNSLAEQSRDFEHKLSIHKFDNSGYASKTVKKTLERLVYLTEGSVYKNLPKIKPAQSSSTTEGFAGLLSKGLNEQMLKTSMYRYIKCCQKGYHPIDKTYLPKSFAEFIYKDYNKALPGSLEGQSWLLECLLNQPGSVDYDSSFYVSKVKGLTSYKLIKSKTMLNASGEKRFDAIMANNLAEWRKLRDLNYMLYKDFNSKAEEILSDPDVFFTNLYRFITEVYLHWENSYSIGHFVWHRPTVQAFLDEFSDKVLGGRSLYPCRNEAWGTAYSRAERLKEAGYKVEMLSDGSASWYSYEDIEFARENKCVMWWEL